MDLDPKVIPTVVTLLLVIAAFTGMWVGWRRRTRRQEAQLPGLEPMPAVDQLGDPMAAGHALYVATTEADDPLNRITAGDLGFRAHATVRVHAQGVVVERDGAQPLFISKQSLDGAGLENYAVDKGVEKGGLTGIDWRWGDREVTSFFRMRRPKDGPAIITAVRTIAPPQSAARRARDLMF
ncbi:PH-like domain-containing protein [Pseudoclavibacter sp. 13-3]|uniref:PH-like domain-containing protein n=1 Tax=Pseudoclavibacter sp. 13-3 TaxID=2901228 RepID=UPI001E49A3C7|nr:hypothetical protein [Pseudoclavibacter sp. 13-3]MCD7101999.1 hypothetical protein [Pseudoclavibacter sp. 13-3]